MSGIYKSGSGEYNTDNSGKEVVPNDLRIPLSKSMSYHLRHDESAPIDSHGWVELPALQDFLNGNFKEDISLEMIKAIVAESDKQRYEIDTENMRIRAVYAHSIDSVNIDMSECTVDSTPETLYHGTPVRNKKSIKENGIQPQGRNTVHLTDDFDTAVETGERHARNGEEIVVFEVDSRIFLDDYTLRNPSGSTYTTSEVPPEYLEVSKS